MSTGHGTEFEFALAKELGLERVPGSGNQWHSKLDVSGKGTRWSLKSTKFASHPVSKEMLKEMVEATEGPGGSGEMPLGAIELGATKDDAEVLVWMRLSDFLTIVKEERKIVRESKADARRRAASVPQLLREEDGG